MRFEEALEVERKTHKGPPCTVGVMMTGLDADDLTALNAALASDTPTSQIARALNAVGHRVPATTLMRHRRGECVCRADG